MAMLSIATSVVTLGLKFGAYFLTGSLSLWSDAVEALVNLAAGAVALGALTIASRPADDKHSYGHDKAEYFSSGVEGALIFVAAIAIIYAALHRLHEPQPLTSLGPGIAVALLAAGMNYATARVMLRVARSHDSITIEADARHLLTDVWTTIGIVVGLTVIIVAPSWSIIDPLVAMAVALHILHTGFDLLKRSADGLMDASLPPPEVQRAEAIIRDALPTNASFHALRTRKAGSRRFLEFHLLLPDATSVADAHALCDRIEATLNQHLPRSQITIHVEPAETQVPHP